MKQFSIQVVFAALGSAVLLLLGCFVAWSSLSRRATDKRVVALAEHLDGQVERGRYRRSDPAAITETDSWGRTLQVEYRDEGIGERLFVRSAGPDGAFNTNDDIMASRFLMNAKGIGEQVKDGTASVAKEAAKGLIRGIKEEVKDTFKRKTTNEVTK